jgi:cation:H+ antiporter
LLGAPAFVLRFSGVHVDPVLAALIYGIGIVGGAFLLSWAAEVAQLDISASFAIALLALIAILPEYAIEAVLAWDAGQSFDSATGVVTKEMALVAANVTGANRLLIGLGWSLVILIFWLKQRASLDLRGTMRLELTMLVAATAVTFLIFFMSEVHIILAGALIVMYLFYLWMTSTHESEEPELIGAAEVIGALPTMRRRMTVLALFVYSAAVILVAAEPFVEALIETGGALGIDEFILIQWVAPLASESPEIIIAVLFSLRANPVAGITILISAEVNQLTLLVGSMVGIFSLSAGELLSFPIDSRQSVEFLLTSAVSVFAIVLIAPRLVGWKVGAVILVLFVAHLFFVGEDERRIFAYLYLGLSAGLVVLDRRRLIYAIGRGPS